MKQKGIEAENGSVQEIVSDLCFMCFMCPEMRYIEIRIAGQAPLCCG